MARTLRIPYAATFGQRRPGLRAAVIVTLTCALAAGQSVVAPQFEVASVRRSNPNEIAAGPNQQILPDGIKFVDRAVLSYVMFAYDLPAYRVRRGKGVSLGDRYSVTAKAAGAIAADQARAMLRTLLTDRFRLTAHVETVEMEVFLMTVAEGGPRFKRSADMSPVRITRNDKDNSLRYSGASMSYLTGTLLSNFPSIGRPVLDRSGLDGSYDFSMRLYDSETGADPKAGLQQQLDNGARSSLRSLGLKLEAARAPVEILVIDHIEPSTEN